MNKLFGALLFFCVVGASVLWWLMKTLPDDKRHPPVEVSHAHEAVPEEASPKATEESRAEVKLSIDTIPSGAKVEIGGVYQGMTPLSVELHEEPVEALIALDGYDVYRHAVPTIDQAEGADLNWKITLKEKVLAPTPHVPPKSEKVKPLVHAWLKGSKGPYFIQIKAIEDSVSKTEIESELRHFRAVLGFEYVSGCLVDLGKKGKWVRVIGGPFSTRAKADAKRIEWYTKKTEVVQGFITGRQTCI